MNVLRNLYKIILSISLLVWVTFVHAQTAYLQPDEISEGDTTVLVIEIEGDTPSLHALDTSKLEEDFEILGTSSSVQVIQGQNQIVNKTHWEIELFPLKTGSLDIPALEINGRFTPKLTLNVKKPAPGSAAAAGKNVFIQMSAEPEDAYIGQQINIIIKLFHNIRIVNGTLSEPEAVNADVYRIGNDISYVQTFDGVKYNVLERTFALFTNSPGNLKILPVSFRGQIEDVDDESSSSFGSFMRQVKQIKRSGNELNLKIQDVPAAFTGKIWLPANDLRIAQEYSEQTNEFNLGDSLNRTIKVIADGLPAEALPKDLYDSTSKLVNIYPDKVSRSNQDIGKKLVGKIEQKFAVILPKSGYVTIPELRLKWWDVDEHIEKEAILPERVLIVGGTAADQTVSNQNNTGTSQVQVNEAQSTPVPVKHPSVNYWQWIALVLFLLWMATLFLWRISRTTPSTAKAIEPENERFNQKALEQACNTNNAKAVRTELIAWARQNWPEQRISGLHNIKIQDISEPFRLQLDELDRALFSARQYDWKADQLWQAFSDENAKPKAAGVEKSAEAIPPLYSH